jgi:DNA-binding transcriptional ArsR family regulator
MVNNSESQLNSVFHALSDSTRRAILARLANGDAQVTELAMPFDMSLPAISKHLGVLEKAGLLHRHKDGRIRRCELIAGPLENAADWVNVYRQFWETRLDSLARYLEKDKKPEVKPQSKSKSKNRDSHNRKEK